MRRCRYQDCSSAHDFLTYSLLVSILIFLPSKVAAKNAHCDLVNILNNSLWTPLIYFKIQTYVHTYIHTYIHTYTRLCAPFIATLFK